MNYRKANQYFPDASRGPWQLSPYSFLLALMLIVLPGTLKASVPLSDGPRGMTCGAHFAAAHASWQRGGGDWLDAQAELWGTEPFDSARVRPSSKRQIIRWDITSLANKWQSGTRPAGAIFLRTLPGAPEGSVNFRSRESADPAVRPLLMVQWDDGEVTSLSPTADTSINCTTIKGLGGSTIISVGGNDNTIVIFPFQADPARKVVSAELKLTTDKQWHNGSDVGIFQVHPPWATSSTPRMGLAASHQGDRDITSHPAVYFATGFEERNWPAGWSHAGRTGKTKPVDDGEGNGFAPLQGRALRTTLVPKANFALDLRYDFAKLHGEEPEEAYFRYYLRFGDNWNPSADGGKLPGFGGTYDRGGWGLRASDGHNGWSARGAFMRRSNDVPEMANKVAIGSYVYHPGIKGGPSTTWGWGMGPTGLLQQNRWYSVEQYVKMNEPGQTDGELKAWVDGRLVFERSNIRFRDTRDLKVENVWFNVYHGGVTKPPHEMSLYIDNVVIARQYIGPMADGNGSPKSP